jgi:hypothetical protein
MLCDLQSVSILFHFLVQPVSLMFCGSLGHWELASAAMALSVRGTQSVVWVIVLEKTIGLNCMIMNL